MMNDPKIMQMFTTVGAVVTNGHFVYTSGRHSSIYINKDALYAHTKIISSLCQLMARPYNADQIDVVVARSWEASFSRSGSRTISMSIVLLVKPWLYLLKKVMMASTRNSSLVVAMTNSFLVEIFWLLKIC